MSSTFKCELGIDDRIESLKAELESNGKEILSFVNSVYSNENINNAQIDLQNFSLQIAPLLRQEMLEIIEESQKHEELIMNSQSDIKFCNDMSLVLSSIAEIVDLMSKCEDCLIGLKFLECNQYFLKIDALLMNIPAENEYLSKGKTCKVLRNEYTLLKTRAKSKILRLMNEFISMEAGTIKVMKKVSGFIRCEDKIIDTPILLDEYWKICIQFDIIEQYLEQFIEQFWSYILVPLWKEKKAVMPVVTTSSDIAELMVISNRNHQPTHYSTANNRSLGNLIANLC
jgi:hypothetical protein